MAMYRAGIYAAFVAAVGIAFSSQTHAADGPNQSTQSDLAAGEWVDSLLGPEHTPATTQGNPLRKRTKQRRAPIRGKLVNNSSAKKGMPPFALLDQYGGVIRYVKPEKGIDLEAYLGEVVTVRRDTGKVLRASSLELPELMEIDLVDHEEPIPAGEPTEAEESILRDEPSDESYEDYDSDEPIYYEDNYMGGSCDLGGCTSCGSSCCGGCGSRGVIYARGEYLNWWFKGMDIPPLVVGIPFDVTDPLNPVPAGAAQTLYGDETILEDDRQGFRVTLGLWLDDCGQWGIEGDYLRFDDAEDRFRAGERDGTFPGDGFFIFRPFFNDGVIGGDETTRGPSLEDVDTNQLDGTVTVDVRSEFQSAGIRLRHNLCCREGCAPCCGDAVGCGSPVGCGSCVQYGPLNRIANLFRYGTRHTDVLYGFRWYNLDERISITEDLQEITVVTGPTITLGDEIVVFDDFQVENNFYGGEIGYETQWKHKRWSFNLLTKVAIGNVNQKASINGYTDIDDGTGPVRFNGGLLTQGLLLDGPDGIAGNEDDIYVGNIGEYERDQFTMIPEIGFTLGYDVTQRLKLNAGYTVVYWGNVIRPSDLIDLYVNANFLNKNPAEGADSTVIVRGDGPNFDFFQSDLWAHGINLGAEYTW